MSDKNRQNAAYVVEMHRPDRKRVVIRRMYREKPIEAASIRQLVGYLTHTLFADRERGGEGTVYRVKAVIDGTQEFVNVRKTNESYEVI